MITVSSSDSFEEFKENNGCVSYGYDKVDYDCGYDGSDEDNKEEECQDDETIDLFYDNEQTDDYQLFISRLYLKILSNVLPYLEKQPFEI